MTKKEPITESKVEMQPHICMPTLDGNVHVLPVQLITRWIDGEADITNTEGWELLIRSICKEWLNNLQKRRTRRTKKHD